MPAGFRRCGLYPIDKNQVLSRMPRQQSEADRTATRQLLDETFSERLAQLRGTDKQKTRKRGAKVIPGKSLCDLSDQEEEEHEEEDEEEPEEEEVDADDLLVDRDSDSEAELVMPRKRSRAGVFEDVDEDEEAGPSGAAGSSRKDGPSSKVVPESSDEFAVGTFVVAMYEGTWYLGQVEGCDPDEEVDGYTCVKYLEKKGENKFTFSGRDILFTLNTDILLTVEHPDPVSSRGFWGLPQQTVKEVTKLVKGIWSIFHRTFLGVLVPVPVPVRFIFYLLKNWFNCLCVSS